MAPRCGQPSWDYWSGADVSISSRHRHALSQPPTITRSPFFPGPGFLSCPPTTNPPSVQTLTDLSDDGFIGSLSLPLPCETRTGLFFFFLHAPSSRPPLIPPRNLHHKKKSLPPPPHPPPLLSHCRLFHLLLSLSLLSLCLILVCASACHIKGEPGVTEPQAWNINAANCVAVWEINPLKIAPYTSWTHHQSLIHIVIYRNSFLWPFVCCIMHRMFSLKTAAVRIVSSTTHLLKEFLYVRKECTT